MLSRETNVADFICFVLFLSDAGGISHGTQLSLANLTGQSHWPQIDDAEAVGIDVGQRPRCRANIKQTV